MGFRFRRSIRIAPGIRWNFGKRSSSISIGRRGATVNVSSRGTRATVGIPGTGLSYTTTVGGGQGASTETPSAAASAPSQVVRLHHLIVVASLGILLWGFLLGARPELIVVGLLGLVYGWVGRTRRESESIRVTNGSNDFDQYLQQNAVMLSHGSETAWRDTVMTRDGQRERKVPEGDREDLGDGVGHELAIVGESHYMAELRALGDRRSDPHLPLEFVATLLREPTNPYDPNAIVVLSDRGNVIGYLSKEDALDYGSVLREVGAAKKTAQCRAKLIGGTRDKPNIGVWLDIDPPKELLERFAAREP